MDEGTINFKFHLLDAKGQPTGFLSTKGQFDGEHITLGKQKLPAQGLIKCLAVNGRLVLLFAGEREPVTVAMKVVKGNLKKLSQSLNMIASVYQTQAHRERLDKNGLGHTYRAAPCPCCRCMIDLTNRQPTNQVYCPFCEHILTLPTPLADENSFELCSRCGLYAQPKMFTMVYFYFLFVIYGYRYKQLRLCNACARSEAWKMLGGNLLFILFVPMAIVQLLRAYGGGAALSTTFKGLDTANALQLGGKFDRAIGEYERIEQRLPAHAGILYNHGRALVAAGLVPDGVSIFRRALEACGNYTPAAQQLFACYQHLGQKEEATQFQKLWDGDAGNPSESESGALAS